MMAASQLQAIASYSSLRLIDSLAEGFIVCFFALVLLRLTGKQNAGTRFAIGFSALMAIALLPLSRGFWGHSHLSSTGPTVVVPESWALYLFSTWAVIAVLLLSRVARSVWHLHRLRETCIPLDPASLDSQVTEALRRQPMWRRVGLCTSGKVRVPTALGLLKPAVVIPKWVLQDLSAAELRQVVLHELAHLRRWDDWTNLAQQVVKALFFFHPAVWWIEKKLALEREVACDDAVLSETTSPRAYAECLAHLAERSFVQRTIALAQAAVGRVAETSHRVARILDANRPKTHSRARKAALSVMAGAGVLCSVWAAKTPELVGFENGGPANTEFATSSLDRVSVPVTNASLVQRSTAEPTKAKAIPAKLSRKATQPSLKSRAPQLAARTEQGASGAVHLTALKSQAVPVSETVLVFIEGRDASSAGTQVYRIQMWHITLLPAAEAVSNKIPNKKT